MRVRARILTRFLGVASVIGVSAVIGFGTASAAPGGSFPGCPALIEGQQSGGCVEALQVYLNIDNPGYGLDVDGTFGPLTRIAVLDFQGRNHLPADGVVGPVTANALIDRAEQVRAATQGSYVNSPVPQPYVNSPVPRGATGEAVSLGKPVGECVEELVKDKPLGDIVEKYAEDKLGMHDIVHKLAKIATPVDAAEAVWCVSFAKPD